MDLWIRSQDKEVLVKVNDIAVEMNMIYGYYDKNTEYELLGSYQSKERALEVLDEMQNKIRGKFLLKSKTILKPETTKSAKKYFEDLNNIDLIAGDKNFDIVPINYTDTVIYEMPKE